MDVLAKVTRLKRIIKSHEAAIKRLQDACVHDYVVTGTKCCVHGMDTFETIYSYKKCSKCDYDTMDTKYGV